MPALVERETRIHPTAIVHPNVSLGAGTIVEPYCILGEDGSPHHIVIGRESTIRAYTRIQGGMFTGRQFETGNYTLIRGYVAIGHRCKVGSYSSIEGEVEIGNDTTTRGRCEIPNGIIGNRCQVYAGVMFYDTPNPPDGPNLPPVIEDDCVLCCNCAILGGVTVGAGSMVSANAFVSRDVPPGSFVKRNGDYVPRR